MGKQGPCCHCGVTITPLWRNGPPEKPVLCNACGSRWRTKGTLANYTPLHLRTETDSEDYRVSRVKTMSLKKKEAKPLKRKQHLDNVLFAGVSPDNHHPGFQKALVDEDISNRSSSGSAISNSESCAQFGNADASDLTGPSQSVVWDTTVPSRKRTCVNRPKQSPVEKLTKDLYSILHEQQSSYISGSSEDLLFESDTPMVSVEIGHGSVLIRHPSSIAQDEESEASSLSLDNKLCPINGAYSCSTALPVHIHRKSVNFSSAGLEEIRKPSGVALQQEQIKRERFQYEKLQVLGNHNSPLSCVDLKDIVNFDEFGKNLSNEEQQQLLKYLPSVDTARLSDSLKSMFNSFQFKENLFSFQQLLAEGVFDTSLSGMKTDDCKTLKRLALVNLTKSKWVEHYTSLKNCKNGWVHPVIDGGNNLKRPNDCRNQNFPEAIAIMRSPQRVVANVSCETGEDNDIDHDTSCFSPSSLFAVPLDGGSFVLESIGSDQDMLLDVRSNGSFPQAELLLPPPSSSFSSTQTSVHNSSIYAHTGRP